MISGLVSHNSHQSLLFSLASILLFSQDSHPYILSIRESIKKNFVLRAKIVLTKTFQRYPNVLIRQILEPAIYHLMTANHVSVQFIAWFVGTRSLFCAGHNSLRSSPYPIMSNTDQWRV